MDGLVLSVNQPEETMDSEAGKYLMMPEHQAS